MNARTRPESLAPVLDAEDSNTSPNPSLMDVVEARLSRRSMFRAAIGTAGAAVLGSVSACGGGDDAVAAPAPAPAPIPATPLSLSFAAVPKGLADAVVVPAGYSATIVYALGDPLTSFVADFRNDGTDTDFDKRAGDHHDGIEFFPLNAAGTARDVAGSDRGVLAMNHEATTDQFLHVNGVTANPRPPAEADKEVDVHGISTVEVRKVSGRFAYQKDSAFNRRITPLTPIAMSGPARGTAQLKTKYSNAGTDTRGTINNCGAGYTPWGTYFAGEENWVNYFFRATGDDAARGGASAKGVLSLARYGKAQGAASRHGWETAGPDDKYQRWNIGKTGTSADGTDDYRNEMNTYGWMVEVDPYDRTRSVKKRTALGRFAHEMGVFGKVAAGKPVVVYMGDDSRGEYVYKFVSTQAWVDADANPADRIATGDKYLDSGKLYVAKFNADGTGQWIELNVANAQVAAAAYGFSDQADVLVNTRLAADAVGATKMDRPEWSAVHPVTGEVYVTLTNNSNRKVEPSGGSQMAVDAANPRSYTDAPTAATAPGNINGHILRFKENGGDGAATAFTWDVYLFGAESGADAGKVNLSALTADNDFSSPDGLWFSPKTGLLFIETDDGAYTDVTNCMLLVGIPGSVGDGATQTLQYTKADSTTLSVTTRVGAKPSAATLRRFLVGPKDCEITGITETPDGRTLFVNIQHPGETIAKANIGDASKWLSHWPANAGYGAGGANGRPRSATIAITRDNGGLVAADGTAVLNSN